eukprot:10086843-Lingulodinium_polyedra.AAC.1
MVMLRSLWPCPLVGQYFSQRRPGSTPRPPRPRSMAGKLAHQWPGGKVATETGMNVLVMFLGMGMGLGLGMGLRLGLGLTSPHVTSRQM